MILSVVLTWGRQAQAQAAGSFVIPAARSESTEFAYWDLFRSPAGTVYNYQYDNPPALADGLGRDDVGYGTTLDSQQVKFKQTGSPTCFVTSSGALYDFRMPTAFVVSYVPPTSAPSDGPVASVIFQTQSGGTRLNLGDVWLYGTDSSGQMVMLGPQLKALDDPQTGAFDERLVSAFQWNLVGTGISAFEIRFQSPASSLALWQAQLDVFRGTSFTPHLGYILKSEISPRVVFSSVGRVDPVLPDGAERRFFSAGQQVTLEATPISGWAHVGWQLGEIISTDPELVVTMPAADIVVKALFAPESYSAWRTVRFSHSNSITGALDDYLNDTISGPGADPDADGVLNVAEFAFGGNPISPDAAQTVVVPSLVSVDGASYAQWTYPVGVGPDSPTFYRVQFSRDLVTWAEAENAVQEISRVLMPNGTTRVTVRDKEPIDSERPKMFRILADL